MAGKVGWVQVTEPNKSPVTAHDPHETLKLLQHSVNKGPEWQTNKFIFSLENNRDPLRSLDERMTSIKQEWQQSTQKRKKQNTEN